MCLYIFLNILINKAHSSKVMFVSYKLSASGDPPRGCKLLSRHRACGWAAHRQQLVALYANYINFMLLLQKEFQ
jgi:hypothetical protein